MKSKLIIDSRGTKHWELSNGKAHRRNGPAIETANGGKAWFLNGQRHREDGPAIEYIDGNKEWFLNDLKYNENTFRCVVRSRKLKQLL
jgi:hypothetical protein